MALAKRALVLAARGCEEVELVTVVNVLRRAAIAVDIAAEGGAPVEGSRQVRIVPDVILADVCGGEAAAIAAAYDALVIPGGAAGAHALAANSLVRRTVQAFDGAARLVAAICAAPTVLVAAGVGKGRRMAVYPTFVKDISAHFVPTDGAVVVDGHFISAPGPAAAIPFALAIVARLAPPGVSEAVAGHLLYPLAAPF